MNPQIFREYDIRGVVEKDLTPEIVRKLGQGYATLSFSSGEKEDRFEAGIGRLSSTDRFMTKFSPGFACW